MKKQIMVFLRVVLITAALFFFFQKTTDLIGKQVSAAEKVSFTVVTDRIVYDETNQTITIPVKPNHTVTAANVQVVLTYGWDGHGSAQNVITELNLTNVQWVSGTEYVYTFHASLSIDEIKSKNKVDLVTVYDGETAITENLRPSQWTVINPIGASTEPSSSTSSSESNSSTSDSNSTSSSESSSSTSDSNSTSSSESSASPSISGSSTVPSESAASSTSSTNSNNSSSMSDSRSGESESSANTTNIDPPQNNSSSNSNNFGKDGQKLATHTTRALHNKFARALILPKTGEVNDLGLNEQTSMLIGIIMASVSVSLATYLFLKFK
jgi:hypothetical protein